MVRVLVHRCLPDEPFIGRDAPELERVCPRNLGATPATLVSPHLGGTQNVPQPLRRRAHRSRDLLLFFGPEAAADARARAGPGMREFKDSITGNSKDDDEDEPAITRRAPPWRTPPRARAAAAPEPERAPADAGPSRALARDAGSRHGERSSADRARRSAEHRRPPRRAPLAADRLRDRARGRVRRLLLAEPRAAEGPQPRASASPKTSANHISGLTERLRQGGARARGARPATLRALARSPTPVGSGPRRCSATRGGRIDAAAKALPQSAPDSVCRSRSAIGEPFTTTLTVVGLLRAAVLAAGPDLPGLRVRDPGAQPARAPRRAAADDRLAPVLFIGGVVFTYLSCCRRRSSFLQGYNSQNFDILVQAKTYYTFEILTMLGDRARLPAAARPARRCTGSASINAQHADAPLALRCRHHRGHRGGAPGVDPVTTALEMLPLILLYLLSIVCSRSPTAATRRARRRRARRRIDEPDSS